ncbi:MAG: class I SAM-dependent methyltransferase [Gammaproteobacteria bacterium]|nr:class I SAM-dependent methyltransferase [Gammaproteobacteria bacterium]
MKHRLSNTFGKNRVTLNERETLVRSVFKRVASRYDLMNDLMSMGVHRLWKWMFCKEVNKQKGSVFVDLAGGTGDIAKAMLNTDRQIMLLDPSVEMIHVAKKRLGNDATYIAATAENIPLPDNSVDVLTISFGIRNTTDIKQSFAEITRVLKPQGRFYCLEFSTPYFWLRPFYNAWSRIVIPRLGAMVAGHPDAYTYLIDSIREFPAQQELADLITGSGLKEVSYSNVSFGIACIHRGVK